MLTFTVGTEEQLNAAVSEFIATKICPALAKESTFPLPKICIWITNGFPRKRTRWLHILLTAWPKGRSLSRECTICGSRKAKLEIEDLWNSKQLPYFEMHKTFNITLKVHLAHAVAAFRPARKLQICMEFKHNFCVCVQINRIRKRNANTLQKLRTNFNIRLVRSFSYKLQKNFHLVKYVGYSIKCKISW